MVDAPFLVSRALGRSGRWPAGTIRVMSERFRARSIGLCCAATMLIGGCGTSSSTHPSPSSSAPSVSSSPGSALSQSATGTPSSSSSTGGSTTTSTSIAGSAPTGVTLPTTAAGRQAAWLLGRLDHLPISDAELAAHFAPAFLAAVPAIELNATLKQVRGLRVTAIVTATATALVANVQVQGTTLQLLLSVGLDGKIGGLRLVPAGAASGSAATPTTVPPAASWSQVDAALKSVVPTARLLVADVTDDTCRTVHGLDATTAAPLGSAFKLYVLDAVAQAIAAGKLSWTQKLTVTDAVKSLPSGELQNVAAGTTVTVQQAALLMISISDNTAADLLLGLVGQNAVEQAMRDTGMADPARNIPFPATRELFVLKLSDYPQLVDQYLAATTAGKSALLRQTHAVPLSALDAKAWTTPLDIDTVEWFASATDICQAYLSLGRLSTQPALAPLNEVLSVNSGQIPLSHTEFPKVWFKGGSEPGVVTLNYRVTTASGRTYVASLLTENPGAAIPTSADSRLLQILAGAIELAAKG